MVCSGEVTLRKSSIDFASLKLESDVQLCPADARKVRGFFASQYPNLPEFHRHKPGGLVYRHPLIQYKVVEQAAIQIWRRSGDTGVCV